MKAPTKSDLSGPLYLEASSLLKCYIPEIGSEELNSLLVDFHDMTTSELALTDVVSALCRRRREGRISEQDAYSAYGRLRASVSAGFFAMADLTPQVHRAAEARLLSAEGIELRAGDALHLALALAAGCNTMVTYDRRLAEASRRHGMMVFPR